MESELGNIQKYSKFKLFQMKSTSGLFQKDGENRGRKGVERRRKVRKTKVTEEVRRGKNR